MHASIWGYRNDIVYGLLLLMMMLCLMMMIRTVVMGGVDYSHGAGVQVE